MKVETPLVGNLVRLEPLSLSHCDGLARFGLDPDLWAWTPMQVRTAEEMRRYIEKAIALRDAGSAVPFATVLKATGEPVGSTRFGNIDRENRRVEIGWSWVARPWQRTAVNTEAKYLMLRHAFEVWNCLRVEFKTDRLNENSRRALARLGAKEEGVLRKHMLTDRGRVRDTVYFSIVDDEWPVVRDRLLNLLA